MLELIPAFPCTFFISLNFTQFFAIYDDRMLILFQTALNKMLDFQIFSNYLVYFAYTT